MIETKSIGIDLELEPSLRYPVLLKLEERGWEAAIMSADRHFMQLAGVLDNLNTEVLRRSDDRRRYSRMLINFGELFFKDSDVFYLVSYGRGYRIRTDRGERDPLNFELGVISSVPDGLGDRLMAFAHDVENSIKECVDGRKARHMDFDWTDKSSGFRGLQRIMGEDSETDFAIPEMNREQIDAARALADKSARQLLIELSQAGFAREQDISKRWTRKEEEFEAALAILKTHSLVQTEYLVECSRTSNTLTRLKSPDQLRESAVGSLICPWCGQTFGQEKLTEGYSISEKGKVLANKSHWMTVWVTELLMRLGVPAEAILWNLAENGEEVDILMGFRGHVWIFELKDREFGAGDAHPLNYRQVRFRATKAVVITTEQVSPDAKRVFQELQRDASLRQGSVAPVFVEGLDEAETILNGELSRLSLRYASSLVEQIGQEAGLNLPATLAARFNEPIDSDLHDEDISLVYEL